ncbi:efflux RND transporter periplasmic adaptor subunit [Insolitispirillum peregrinum]|uniref:HlyD family secretion protein n=1 Tax=Insolitispirillum peregrinum TaxID=80876 RepID=A0A1N7QCP8_9PROT|nr:HlyD family efflux transporter periplasmic adaptor subunit [Insolitispirillum peregrinum]SIT20658.1 HlyD family secretion protein [Insolitispirillum peregrinum]
MTMMSLPSTDGAAGRLAVLVQLEQRARSAETPQALAFVMVNDTRGLLDYRRALFWDAERRTLQACSGLVALEPQSPLVGWLTARCQHWQGREDAARVQELNAADMVASDAQDWAEHVNGRLFWLPIRHPDRRLAGALLLDRDLPFTPADLSLLTLLLDGYGHAWAALHRRTRSRPRINPRSRRLWIGAGAAAVLACLFPVRQSVLAPAEIVARDPAVLRAPVQAVVEQILVRPNQPVVTGEPVVRLDTREWESRRQSALQELTVADAEYRQAQQQALFDDRSKAGLATLRGRIEQARADVAFIEDNLSRMTITAPRSGVAIYDDPSEWIGRPVALGERIMQIAEPGEGELEIHLPVADAIDLPPGAEIRLFLNNAPASPLGATLDRIGYRASPTADGIMAYRVSGLFVDGDSRIRVGLKGTAKLYGERTVLLLYVLRRPLTALRIHLGW